MPEVAIDIRTAFDGTAPFTAGDGPGEDSAPDNGIVRTLDYVGIEVDYQFNNVPEGETRTVRISVERGGFDSIPSICGPNSVVSPDTSTLSCEIVPTPTAGTVGTIVHPILVGAGEDGEVFSVQAQSLTDSLTSPVESQSLTISAAPYWDLVVAEDSTQVFTVDFDDGRSGWLVSLPMTVEVDLAATSDGRGAEGLVGPIDFAIDTTLFDGNGVAYDVELWDLQAATYLPDVLPCSANETPYFSTPQKNASSPNSLGTLDSTSESGDWTCSQAAPGDPILVNIANADFSPNRFPPGTLVSGTYAPRRIMLSGYVTVKVFESGQIQDSAPQGGVFPITFDLYDFDPTGLSGGSNFGAGIETTTNNQGTASLSTTPPGFWDSYYINNSHFIDPVNAHPGYPDDPADSIYLDVRPSFLNPVQPYYYPTQSQDDHTGDGVVFPGATWEYYQHFGDSAGAPVPPGIMCFAFDPATSTVVNSQDSNLWSVNTDPGDLFGTNVGPPTALPATGSPVWVHNHVRGASYGAGAIDSGTAVGPIIEYGTAVAPLDGSAVSCDDDDATNWTTDVSAFDDGTGRYPTLTTIRAFWPEGIPAGEDAQVTVTLEADDVAAGTIISSQSAWALYDPDTFSGTVEWSNQTYDEDVHDNFNFGDRMVLSDRTMLVAKEIVTEVTGPLLPGAEVTFRLTGRIDGSAADMVLTDIVPDGMTVVDTSVAPSVVTPGANPGDPDVYVWVFPDHTGVQGVEYTAVIDADAPDGATLLNILIGSATIDGANALSQDAGTLQSFQRVLLQDSFFELDVWKSTPEDTVFVGELLPFQLHVGNVANETLTNLDVIDVLPWNGDDRDSDFSGTYELLAPVVSADAATPIVLTATADDPATMSPDPLTNTSTWCLAADFGTAGCPADWAEVTALRVTGDELLAGEEVTVDITLDPSTNLPDDVYGNLWAARSDQMLFTARSEAVNIDVVGNTLAVTLVCGDDPTQVDLPFTVTDGSSTASGTTNGAILENLQPGDWMLTVDISSLELDDDEVVVTVTMVADVDTVEPVVLSECGTATPTTTTTTTTTAPTATTAPTTTESSTTTTVVVPSTTTAPSTSVLDENLPETGGGEQFWSTFYAGMLILFGGAALVLLARRRPTVGQR